jgi:hypothetical protein
MLTVATCKKKHTLWPVCLAESEIIVITKNGPGIQQTCATGPGRIWQRIEFQPNSVGVGS